MLLDGVSLGHSTYDQPTSWNNYQPGIKLRTINGWWTLSADRGLTTGRHTVTIRVRTSYHAVTELTSRILVSNRVDFGTVTSAGRTVSDGFVVTAGTHRRFTVPVTTKVTGTRLVWVEAHAGNQNLLPTWPCSFDLATCPLSATVRTDVWAAPNRPGTRTLTFTAYAEGDTAQTLTQTIRVQPAARLSLDVSTHLVAPGRSVRFTGRLTRLDTGIPQPGRTVHLQWRRTNGTR